jgi:hypothetical protein
VGLKNGKISSWNIHMVQRGCQSYRSSSLAISETYQCNKCCHVEFVANDISITLLLILFQPQAEPHRHPNPEGQLPFSASQDSRRSPHCRIRQIYAVYILCTGLSAAPHSPNIYQYSEELGRPRPLHYHDNETSLST